MKKSNKSPATNFKKQDSSHKPAKASVGPVVSDTSGGEMPDPKASHGPSEKDVKAGFKKK